MKKLIPVIVFQFMVGTSAVAGLSAIILWNPLSIILGAVSLLAASAAAHAWGIMNRQVWAIDWAPYDLNVPDYNHLAPPHGSYRRLSDGEIEERLLDYRGNLYVVDFGQRTAPVSSDNGPTAA